MDQRKIIAIKREPVIMIMKATLVERLASFIPSEKNQRDFKILCDGIEAVLRDQYDVKFERLKHLHHLFNPFESANNLKQLKEDTSMKDLEQMFLADFHYLVMEKSNFKLLTKEEWVRATESQYQLKLRITVDQSRLDTELLRGFHVKHEYDIFDHRFLIYRRGIGIDKTAGFYMLPKLDQLGKSLWNMIVGFCRDDETLAEAPFEDIHQDSKIDYIERVHIEDIRIKHFFQKVELQEPTFSQVIVLYRRKPQGNEPPDLGIHIKQFKDIPMADMELVLPEKKTPNLSRTEWFKLVISAVAGVAAFWESFRGRASHVWIAFTVLAAFFSYCFKVYITFHTNVLEYEKLISKAVYTKQLDSGLGTLLHLCEDVIHQEVKEAVVAYFVLMTQGKATEKELGFRCEALLETEFKEKCDFEIKDAIEKLLTNLKIVTEELDNYNCYPLQDAIGRIEALRHEIVASSRNRTHEKAKKAISL